MSQPAAETAESKRNSGGLVRPRSPAVPVAIAFAAGILADRWIGGAPLVWLVCSLCGLAGWGIATRLAFILPAAIFLLMAASGTGGVWHHIRWSVVPTSHVAAYADISSRPVRLTGILNDEPSVIPRREQEFTPAIPQYDRTLFVVDCTSLQCGTEKIHVSGAARVEVTGHLLHAHVGDEVDLVGRFAVPSAARNPGAFDFRQYLRSSGIHAVVRCEEPDDVRVKRSGYLSWRRWQSRLRTRAETLLKDLLSERTAPVGVALLLGTRSTIPDELRTAFAESGTMHILAISGSNVAILAALLWILARAIRLGRTGAVVLTLGGVVAYAFIADNQPPVLRAVLMISALTFGRPWHRTGSPVNALALAALGVLVWNPSHLFDAGAQLSFLAVAALIWAPRGVPAFLRESTESADGNALRLKEWTIIGMKQLGRAMIAAHITIAAIWLFTLPLTLARFNLFSPVGFAVNVLLAPLVVVVLWCGYGLLIVGLPFPGAASVFAAGFDGGLRLMLSAIESAARIPGGHLYLTGPSDIWLAGFYACLAGAMLGTKRSVIRRWGWRALLAWTAGGLGIAALSRPPEELRFTFLAVGHGAAVLVDLPNGKTLLYDAGQLQDGTRAQQIVQSALWATGKSRIDALVLSHADVDHFNAVPGLARTIPIDAAFMHPSFLDFRQESVRKTCDALAARHIPIHLVWSNDRLPLDAETTLRVLHPPAGQRDRLDNANSLVLAIEYASRLVLLTGDLEQSGMSDLLRQPRTRADVLLAPHHGSLTANPRALADWAAPEWVIVSGGQAGIEERLRGVYPDANQVLSTHVHGAVTVTISATGKVDCTPFAGPHSQ